MEEQQTQGEPSAKSPEGIGSDLILELNFVPSWARKPPEQNRFDAFSGEQLERRPTEGPRARRGRRPETAGRPRQENRPPLREMRGRRRPERIEVPKLHLRFVPDQKQLSAVIRQLHASMKSYPLMEVASLFLSQPSFCHIMIEGDTDHGGGEVRFYQCKACRAAALDRATLVSHILGTHLEDYFDKEEKVTEPPAGQFVVIARCGLSGALLGPPNHHSYAERVQEVHRARYPDMPLEVYKKRIEIVREPELIEKWKEECRKQTLYRLKNQPAGAAEPLKLAAAEAYLAKNTVPSLVAEARRVTVPIAVVRTIQDQGLMRVLRASWERENRHPYSLSLALRGAFRNRHMHIFKAGKGMEFVASIKPVPLDPGHAIDSIREVLMYLQEHPGCTRKELVEALRPGAAPGSPEASKVLSPLGWLIERGHIIEFFNGTLSVPLRSSPTGNKDPVAPAPEAR